MREATAERGDSLDHLVFLECSGLVRGMGGEVDIQETL